MGVAKRAEKWDEGKKEARRRMRRREIGMATTEGIAYGSNRKPFTRTLGLLRAAFRVWETRNEDLQTRSVWQRRT